MKGYDIRVIDLTVTQLLEIMDARYSGKDSTVIQGGAKPSQSEYMDIAQCAELTGYSIGYLRQLIHKRKLPFHKKPNFKPVRFLRSEILEWMGGKKYTPIDEMADDYISNNKVKRR